MAHTDQGYGGTGPLSAARRKSVWVISGVTQRTVAVAGLQPNKFWDRWQSAPTKIDGGWNIASLFWLFLSGPASRAGRAAINLRA